MNEVIGIFMGGQWRIKKIAGRNHRRFYMSEKLFDYVKSTMHLNYHKSWDELMPVVKKIEKLENRRFGFTIDSTHVVITDYKGKCTEIIWVHEYPDNGDTKMSMTYDAVYQFIQWFNQQKQNNEQSAK